MKLIVKVAKFISLILLISSGLIAQKIDLDRVGFTHSSRTLPSNPLPVDMRSYRVSIVSSLPESINRSKEENFFLSGLRKNQSKGSIDIKFRFDEILINKSTPIERVEVNKDRSGKEIGRKLFYRMEVLYTLAASCIATDPNGRTVLNNIDNANRVYNSIEFNNITDAQNFWFNNMSSLKIKMVEDLVNQYTSQITNILNSQIGYAIINTAYILWITDSPKHSENTDFARNTRSVINKIKNISATGNIIEYSKQFIEEIKYFEGISSKYTSTQKPDVKLRYGAYYNLGMIYLCLDQVDNASQVAEALIQNDYDKSDGRFINDIAKNIKKLMSVNNMKTTHFEDDFILNN